MSTAISWKASEILEAVTGKLLSGDKDKLFSGVSIDSRRIIPDEIFVAIRGDRHDGHTFIDDVVKKNVKGFLISESQSEMIPTGNLKDQDLVFISVPDTTKALGNLASFNRNRTSVRIIAITGSNGKTTTRKMISAVVSRRFPTLSSHGNLNNHIGLPLTLLNLRSEHRYAVLEMGANHPGEIAYLARICNPEIAVITNVGPAHLEGFGSIEGVALAKGELLDHMAPDGLAVLNAEDKRVFSMAARAPGQVLFYGTSEKAHVRALKIVEGKGKTSFTLQLPNQQIEICIKISGHFMVLNALAAACVGYHLGIGADEIKKALENDFEPAPGRLNIFEIENGIHVIDDTYNANPESMDAALGVLESLKKNHRGIFVAGDMLELGAHSASLHKKIGKRAADAKISLLYAFGQYACNVADGAISGGMSKKDIFTGNKNEILNDLALRLRAGDWVLIKGSRGMGMENIVEGLKNQMGKS